MILNSCSWILEYDFSILEHPCAACHDGYQLHLRFTGPRALKTKVIVLFFCFKFVAFESKLWATRNAEE